MCCWFFFLSFVSSVCSFTFSCDQIESPRAMSQHIYHLNIVTSLTSSYAHLQLLFSTMLCAYKLMLGWNVSNGKLMYPNAINDCHVCTCCHCNQSQKHFYYETENVKQEKMVYQNDTSLFHTQRQTKWSKGVCFSIPDMCIAFGFINKSRRALNVQRFLH